MAPEIDNDDSKILIAKRGQVKASVTRFQTYLDSITNENKNNIELRKRLAKFETLLDKFDDLQSQIEILDKRELENTERVSFETTYYNLVAKVEKMLTEGESLRATNTDNISTRESINENVNSQIRLPRINLPQFSGSYEEWYPFHDTFASLIHDNDNINNIQKLHYLKSSLKGDALDLLHALEISSENYDVAWNLIKDRYDNKRLIVQKHIRAILEIPAINKENHLKLRTLLDSFLKHIRSLKSLDRPTQYWDDLLITIIVGKLDSNSIKDWENSLTKNELPRVEDLIKFLSHKCQTLEIVYQKSNNQVSTSSFKNQKGTINNKQNCFLAAETKCPICNKSHAIYHCEIFTNLPIEKRINISKEKRLCLNCLKSNHSTFNCTKGKCRQCNRKHNSLLHLQSRSSNSSSNNSTEVEKPLVETLSSQETNVSLNSSLQCLHSSDGTQVLLSTAIIHIFDSAGKQHVCRALLDSGSQSNFITADLSKRLGLRQYNSQIRILGLNGTHSKLNKLVKAVISSRFYNYKINLDCLVLNTITERTPRISIKENNFQVPSNIKLADPDFNKPGDIDLLLGAGLFYQLLCVGQIASNYNNNQIIFQKSLLGWLATGKVNIGQSNLYNINSICNLSTINSINHNLEKFWQIEEIPKANNYSLEENKCETHFQETHGRLRNGRFIVKLPFRCSATELGDSKGIALKRFYSLERKLDQDITLKQEYTNFIHEYIKLGHMKERTDTVDDFPNFFLPHHAVIKENSLTTKLRVVFDASMKTSNGRSLNDILMVGPTIQEDLYSILIRFRTYKIVLTADIEKMFRQVLVDKNDTRFQRVFWRDNKNENIKQYELQTVTYGMGPASYLATRCLAQIASEEKENFKVGYKTITRDFYMDDLLTGANSEREAIIIRDEVISILNKAGFKLRKWASNKPSLIQNISLDCENAVLDLDKNGTIKTLGLQWDALNDNLVFSIKDMITNTRRITKRSILADVASIFDPLGLISPITVKAKIILQNLWQLKLDWDECVPIEIHTLWINYRRSFTQLNSTCIPRNVLTEQNILNTDIIGFCDASTEAYGACMYVRTTNAQGVSCSKLLCSKSRVAPLKQITVPRLELCGALLLAQLVDKTLKSLKLEINNIFYFTDSTIVLGWLKTSSRSLNTFIANRVSEIQRLTNISNWNHIRTNENPADALSRGVSPEQLSNLSIWWNGPLWLSEPYSEWPINNCLCLPDIDIPEQRKVVLVSHIKNEQDLPIINSCSSFNKLIRIVAYCLRFVDNAQSKITKKSYLSLYEMKRSTRRIIQYIQKEHFTNEIHELQVKGTVNRKNRLLTFHPFIDDEGILRVGGRLKNSNLNYNAKYPILLPANHNLTKLIILHYHKERLHSGCEATLAAIREVYWPLSGRSMVRKIVKNCVKCFRIKPLRNQPIMGNLPASRVTPSRPFSVCGVDYCGPFLIKEGSRRSKKVAKAYIAVFVCFATRAVHLELVSSLTSESFIATLKRFIARRGKPVTMFSDNGTNFVGANRELRGFFRNNDNVNNISDSLTNSRIDWHFIPANSPHFGGLWEAAVKSAKGHIKRIAGNASLTFEEMITLLSEIESILNSRPITPISNDPSDPSFLTPGHFLIGESLTNVAETNLQDEPTNRLTRWQRIQQLKQHFWKRWSKEYLGLLQRRTKWKSDLRSTIKKGQLVILRDDNLPPLLWKSGRITDVHEGNDGVIRAATIKTSSGSEVSRAVNRFSVLPIENNE